MGQAFLCLNCVIYISTHNCLVYSQTILENSSKIYFWRVMSHANVVLCWFRFVASSVFICWREMVRYIHYPIDISLNKLTHLLLLSFKEMAVFLQKLFHNWPVISPISSKRIPHFYPPHIIYSINQKSIISGFLQINYWFFQKNDFPSTSFPLRFCTESDDNILHLQRAWICIVKKCSTMLFKKLNRSIFWPHNTPEWPLHWRPLEDRNQLW